MSPRVGEPPVQQGLVRAQGGQHAAHGRVRLGLDLLADARDVGTAAAEERDVGEVEQRLGDHPRIAAANVVDGAPGGVRSVGGRAAIDLDQARRR